MKRYKFYLPVMLSFLLVMGCMMPASVYASDLSRDTQQITKKIPAEAEGLSLLPDAGLVVESNKTAEAVADSETTCITGGCGTLQTEGGFTTCSAISGGGVAYHIESPEQLAHICKHLNLDYIQTKDIDLGISEFNEGWIPIGGFDGSADFSGNYNGNGFEIENMVLNHSTSSGSITAGLFAKASDKAHLENINLSINDIYLDRGVPEGEDEPEPELESRSGSGSGPGPTPVPVPFENIIVGGITGEHYPNYTIENCNVTIGAIFAANYNGNIYVGGVAGINHGSISGCNISITDYVILGADYGYLFFGGITAQNEYYGEVDRNKSLINSDIIIFGDEDFLYGGIAGDNRGKISNCYSEGECNLDVNLLGYVEDPSGEAYLGGVCGFTSGIIEHSGQSGVIEANINCETDEPTALKNAVTNKRSTSKNAANSESKIYESDDETNGVYVGGIAGYVMPNGLYGITDQENNPASIFNTDHTGSIYVESDNNNYVNVDNLYVGGIAGYVNSQYGNMLLIENCQNNGSVRSNNLSGSSFSGGIAGYIYQDMPMLALTETDYDAGVKILNCANHLSDSEIAAYGINEMAIAGGIVGASRFTTGSQPTIENTYNRGDVYSELTYYDMGDSENVKKGYQCEGSASGGIIGASGGANVLTSYSSADLVTSSAVVPADSINGSFTAMEMPVLSITGYAGGIAGLIWGTEFNQDYYETNGNVVNGIGGAVVEYTIEQSYADPNVTGASASQLKSRSFFGDAWKWYASGGTAPQYYNSDEPWRIDAADAYPVLRGKPYQSSPPSNNTGTGGGGSSVETPPPVAGLPDGTLIDRMAGYIAFSEPSKINEVKGEIELAYDTALQKNNSANSPRIYYWNADKKNWVALATYQEGSGKVKAVNDGKYKGWFVAFGVIQPEFSDIQKSWAEQVINRMNGLGMVEGYPSGDKPMLRTVLPEREVSYAEFTMLISRLLNIDIDDPRLPLISEEESRKILDSSFTDGDRVPGWVLQAAGTLSKGKILPGNREEFQANTEITRLEAAVMISKALTLLTATQKADLSKFTDTNEIPDWAKSELVEGAMLGYPDGTFRPNGHLTRAEALTLLHRLFVEGLGW